MMSTDAPAVATKTILLVDDERDFLLSLADALETLDQSLVVLLAHHGGEALDILHERKVDLMVTDLLMPGIDGFELLERTAESHPDLPTMVMTSVGSPDLERHTRELGSCAYFEKPLNLMEMMAAIRAVFHAGKSQGASQ